MKQVIHKKETIVVIIVVAIMLSAPLVFSGEQYFKAGFDCAKATTRIEKTICSVKELADADVEMTTIYKSLLSNLSPDEKDTLKHDQLSWLKERESSCNNSTTMGACLKDLYVRRIDVLKKRSKQIDQQQPSNEEALYRRLLSPDKSIQEPATNELVGLDIAAKEILSQKLVQTLKTGDEATRRRAANALIKIGSSAVPFVIQAYNDEHREVRLSVMTIFMELGPTNKEVIPTVLKGLDDIDAIVRMVATDALGKIKSATPEIIGALAKATEDKDSTVRNRACEALGNIGPSAVSAVPAIVKVLEDNNDKTDRNKAGISLMHQQAAVALGQIGSRSDLAISALVRIFKDKQEYVRYAAAQALIKIGSATIPVLLKSLKDNDIYTRIEAVRALGEIGPVSVDVEPALIGALGDDNFTVRSGAAFALRNIKTESSRAALAKYREDERVRSEQVKMKREEELHKHYTKGEIVSNVPPDADHKYPLELVYGFGIRSYNQNELYVTLHRGKDRPDLLRIWLRINDEYALIKEMKSDEDGESRFGQVDSIWYDMKQDHREQFIHIPLLFSGTGGFREDTIFCVVPDMSL